MIKSKYRTIISDFDDTITTSEGKVPSAVKEAVSEFISMGGNFVISTGRSFDTVQPRLREVFGETNISLISTLQGGQIYHNGKLIVNHTLNKERLAEYIKEIFGMGLNCHTYSGSRSFAQKKDTDTDFYEKLTGAEINIVPDLCEFVLHGGLEFNKHLTFVKKDQETVKNIMQKKFPDFKLVFSRPEYMEALPPDGGKEYSVDCICGILNVKREETVCIGDGDNDAGMIKRAGLGVAVANGCTLAREAADLIVPSSDEAGIAYLIQKVIKGEV